MKFKYLGLFEIRWLVDKFKMCLCFVLCFEICFILSYMWRMFFLKVLENEEFKVDGDKGFLLEED